MSRNASSASVGQTEYKMGLKCAHNSFVISAPVMETLLIFVLSISVDIVIIVLSGRRQWYSMVDSASSEIKSFLASASLLKELYFSINKSIFLILYSEQPVKSNKSKRRIIELTKCRFIKSSPHLIILDEEGSYS